MTEKQTRVSDGMTDRAITCPSEGDPACAFRDAYLEISAVVGRQGSEACSLADQVRALLSPQDGTGAMSDEAVAILIADSLGYIPFAEMDPLAQKRFLACAAALRSAQSGGEPTYVSPSCNCLDGARPLPFDRDTLGRLVREAWVRWAQTQPNPKPTWLAPYDELTEPDKEADRQIGEAIARWALIGDAASRSQTSGK